MKSKIVKQDFRGITNFIKAIGDGRVVDVGIMGDKSARKQGKNDNAYLGFLHEFGVPGKFPARSFLRMPILLHQEDILEAVKKAGALKKLSQGNMLGVLRDIGIACEKVVLQAFSSSGFGSWMPNSPSTIRRKKSSAPLIDTGQLRRSITSAVVTL